MTSLRELQELLEGQQGVLATCNEFLGLVPGDADVLKEKSDAEASIQDLEAKIAAATSKTTKSPITDALPPPPPPPSADSIPPPPPPPSEEAYTSLSVGDQVMAKWSEDKQMYQAIIISKTGSSTDPVYTVKFKSYGNTETIRKHEVKPIESKKRKADGIAVPAPPSNPYSTAKQSNSSSVISAAPTVETTMATKRVPSKVSDGPTRLPPEPKKLKGNKALDKAKNSWNSWQHSGPKKSSVAASAASAPAKKKESQFRTGDLPGAKVGFTGSGKAMSKDQSKGVWKFTGEDD